MSDPRGATGRAGEQAAVDYLRQRGLRIVATNWRTRHGEIDVVAEHGGTIVFVEVRTRTSDRFATAAESVGPRKQRKLVQMAEQFLQEHAPGAAARIDVVTVLAAPGRPPRIDHLIGAVGAQ